MSCGEIWKSTINGDMPMHQMTNEHLENAEREVLRQLDLARSEARGRLAQVAVEKARRQRVWASMLAATSAGPSPWAFWLPSPVE